MQSEECICNNIKAMRRYYRLNAKHKSISTKIDEELDHDIVAKVHIKVNMATGSVSASTCIRYFKHEIYPQKFGKLNCHNNETINKFNKYYTTSIQRGVIKKSSKKYNDSAKGKANRAMYRKSRILIKKFTSDISGAVNL